MLKIPLTHHLPSVVSKIPLRFLLVAPFILQIGIAVGLTGYFSLQNGQKAVQEVTSQLRRQITTRIDHHLKNYLTQPDLINQLNADAVGLNQLNLSDLSAWERHFWQQHHHFQDITSLALINDQGQGIAITENGENQLIIQVAHPGTDQTLHLYEATAEGKRGTLLKTLKNFDPRLISFYTQALESPQPISSTIVLSPTLDIPVIAMGQRVRSPDNQRAGVLISTLRVSGICEFLQTLNVGKTGQTFIVDRAGTLMASSLKLPNTFPLLAENSSDLITQSTAQFLKQKFGNFSGIQNLHQLEFSVDQQKQFVEVFPLQVEPGIDWLIVVVVPESDFMAEIDANTRLTVILCLLALAVATLSGLLTSQWITNPLRRLSEASQLMAEGNLEPNLEPFKIEEFNALVTAFNQMSRKVKASRLELETYSRSLEAKVEERTQALALEIQERTEAEITLQKQAESLARQNEVLVQLAKDETLHQGDFEVGIKKLTEAIVYTLQVDRVSVWFNQDNPPGIQ